MHGVRHLIHIRSKRIFFCRPVPILADLDADLTVDSNN